MEEESLSGQAITSVPLLYLLIFKLWWNYLLRLTCFQWLLAHFLKNKPHVPQSHPSPTFPHLFPQFFPSTPPPSFRALLCFPFCPCLSSPCAPSEQAVMGVMGSSCGRAECALWLALECCYDLNRKSSLLLPTFPPVPLKSKGFTNLTSYPATPESQQPTRRKAAEL